MQTNIDNYMKNIKANKFLSYQEEVALILDYQQTNNKKSLEKVINANLRYVVKLAHKFKGYNVSLPDLIQEGNIGLMRAVKKYDASKNKKFMLYAYNWIKYYMIEYIVKNYSMISIGDSKYRRTLFFNMKKTIFNFQQKFNRSPSNEEISKELNVPEHMVETAKQMMVQEISLDVPLSEESDMNRLALIEDDNSIENNIATKLKMNKFNKHLKKVAKILNKRENLIMNEHFLKEDPKTLTDIGNDLGISREAIRQSKEKLLNKLYFIFSNHGYTEIDARE